MLSEEYVTKYNDLALKKIPEFIGSTPDPSIVFKEFTGFYKAYNWWYDAQKWFHGFFMGGKWHWHAADQTFPYLGKLPLGHGLPPALVHCGEASAKYKTWYVPQIIAFGLATHCNTSSQDAEKFYKYCNDNGFPMEYLGIANTTAYVFLPYLGPDSSFLQRLFRLQLARLPFLFPYQDTVKNILKFAQFTSFTKSIIFGELAADNRAAHGEYNPYTWITSRLFLSPFDKNRLFSPVLFKENLAQVLKSAQVGDSINKNLLIKSLMPSNNKFLGKRFINWNGDTQPTTQTFKFHEATTEKELLVKYKKYLQGLYFSMGIDGKKVTNVFKQNKNIINNPLQKVLCYEE